jgi:hypothetical protein
VKWFNKNYLILPGIFKNIFILFILLIFNNTLFASNNFYDGQELFDDCSAAMYNLNKDGSEDKDGLKLVATASCLRFIDGVEEGYGIANFNKKSFCIPRAFRMSERALVIVNYLKKFSAENILQNLPASGLVIHAYKEYFPCPDHDYR